MKYRKRSVIIEALRYDGTNYKEIEAFVGVGNLYAVGRGTLWIEFKTLEGFITAIVGDFIIKGVKGEFYPCKSDIFAETYEQVELDTCEG